MRERARGRAKEGRGGWMGVEGEGEGGEEEEGGPRDRVDDDGVSV